MQLLTYGASLSSLPVWCVDYATDLPFALSLCFLCASSPFSDSSQFAPAFFLQLFPIFSLTSALLIFGVPHFSVWPVKLSCFKDPYLRNVIIHSAGNVVRWKSFWPAAARAVSAHRPYRRRLGDQEVNCIDLECYPPLEHIWASLSFLRKKHQSITDSLYL